MIKWLKNIFNNEQKVYDVYFKHTNTEIRLRVKDINSVNAKKQAKVYIKHYSNNPNDFKFIRVEEK